MFCSKIIIGAAAALMLAASPYLPSAHAATLGISGGKAVLQDEGTVKPLPQEEFKVLKLQDSSLQLLIVGEEQAKGYGLPEGLYIFNKDDSPVGGINHPYVPNFQNLFLSPDKKFLLMDAGTSMMLDVFIYSYPDLRPVRAPELSYYSSMAEPMWVGNDQFVYSTIDTKDRSRDCDYDPCGPVSTKLFNITSGKETVIKQGDPLCDHFALRVDKGNVIIGTRCLPTAEDWRNYPKTPLKESSVKLD